jgi:hypothetical protein
MTVGMEKQFFNGSSIVTALGTNNNRQKGEERGSINYIETEIGFPLFSSSRTLERVIKRTFEENELYANQLDYVEAVRENIKDALEQYYDLIPRIQIYKMLKTYRSELNNLLLNNTIPLNDKEQIEGEITNLNSDITGWEITLYALQLNMQQIMNVEKIDLDQLMTIDFDFSKNGYFGEYYIEESSDTIFNKALNNDTQFKVLGIIKKNAKEKKRLAEKGKWDIYATTGGRYNFYDSPINVEHSNFFMMDAGLKVKINDRKVLQNTISKSQADIDAIEYTILDRRKVIQSDILHLKDALSKKKEQIISTSISLKSWKKTYNVKKQRYLSGQESIDNLIQVFRSLVQTNKTFYRLENNYLDRIRDLDFVCGEYFTVINLYK